MTILHILMCYSEIASVLDIRERCERHGERQQVTQDSDEARLPVVRTRRDGRRDRDRDTTTSSGLGRPGRSIWRPFKGAWGGRRRSAGWLDSDAPGAQKLDAAVRAWAAMCVKGLG